MMKINDEPTTEKKFSNKNKNQIKQKKFFQSQETEKANGHTYSFSTAEDFNNNKENKQENNI